MSCRNGFLDKLMRGEWAVPQQNSPMNSLVIRIGASEQLRFRRHDRLTARAGCRHRPGGLNALHANTVVGALR